MADVDSNQTVIDFLRSVGLRATLDENDGWISFKFEGENFSIRPNEGDPSYFCIAYFCFWEIESEEERVRAAIVACEVTATVKLAKVWLAGGNVHASLEFRADSIESYRPFFVRGLGVIRCAVDKFCETMREGAGQA
jgi:hypothetical protein